MDNLCNTIEIVAIYLRKSRENEEEDVLIKHRTILVELAEKFKWKYILYPEVVSGDTIASRPQMKKLINDINDDLYDAVLVVDIDRLGRGEQEDQGLIKKTFSKTNTLIVTPNKIYNLNDDMDDDFYDMQAFMARQEYKMIKRRFKRGKKIGSRLGRWTNGIPPLPYLYDAKLKGLVVNDELKPIYLKIKDLFLNKQMGTTSIAWEFNKLGYPTPRNGKMWHSNTIFRLLVDETHLGRIISNKTKGNPHKGEKVIKLPREEWIIVENCHEAIKTIEEHEQILAKLKLNSNMPDRAKQGVFAFSGLVYCSKCGRRMQFSRKCFDKEEVFIKCATYNAIGEKCSTVGCREKLLIEGLKKFITNFNIKEIEVSNQIKNTNIDNELLHLKLKEENQLKEELNKIFQAYEKGIYNDDEFIMRKKEKQNQLELCQSQLNQLDSSINNEYSISKNTLVDTLIYLKDLDILPPKEINDLLKTIFEKFIYTRNSRGESPTLYPVLLPIKKCD